MKVCIVTAYYHPVRGGVTTYVSNLAKALRKNQNIKVDIITRFGESSSDVCAINRNKFFFVVNAFFVLLQKKPEVLHSQGSWYILLPCVMYKIFHPKVTVVYTFHTDPIKKLSGLKKRIFEWMLNRCDTLIFVSNFLRDKISQSMRLHSKMRVIHAGVSVREVDDKKIREFKGKFGLEDNAPIITFVGGLVWEMKVAGVKRLIEAFKIVGDHYPSARLLIVGGGMYQRELEKLAENLGIRKKIVFTGFLEDVFTPLAITDIYAHISLQEGLPIAVLEAMAMKKPIIASPTGGIPELVINGKTGLLVETNPKSIADAIIDLYENKVKAEELIQNAYAEVTEKYSWEKIANRVLEVYKKV